MEIERRSRIFRPIKTNLVYHYLNKAKILPTPIGVGIYKYIYMYKSGTYPDEILSNKNEKYKRIDILLLIWITYITGILTLVGIFISPEIPYWGIAVFLVELFGLILTYKLNLF